MKVSELEKIVLEYVNQLDAIKWQLHDQEIEIRRLKEELKNVEALAKTKRV